MTLSSFSPSSSSPFLPRSSSNSTFLSPTLRPSAAATTAAKLIPALCAQASPATPSFSIPSSNSNSNSHDQALIALLRQRKTEEAWQVYSSGPSASIPSSTCLSRLLAQLSYQNTPQSLSRAQSIISRLRHAGQLHRLDSNSLGLLAASSAKSGDTRYANSIIKSMLRSNFLPHVKAWSAVVSRLAASPDDGPIEAIRLFYAVTRRVRRLDLAGDSRPDTAAFNAVLNACANAGDVKKFCQVFDEMPQWNVAPDVLTYNVLIKLCGRAGRKDLLVSVLEMLMVKGIQPCATTFHSLVAAYVGFADLDSAEKLVQAMRDGRRDVCQILRDANLKSCDKKEENSDEEDDYDDDDDDDVEEEEEVKHVNSTENDEFLDKLIPKAVKEDGFVPPLLPKEYAPDSRIYTTLMKGYMKAGRISDTVRTLEAMRHQKDASSHPDHVSYTTVISAFVKAGSMDRARQVLAEMTRVGVPANRVTYNILLKGYCHQLQIERAKELVKEMTKAEILPDVVSYNTLIDGCILAEDSSGALNYFNEMRARGLAPTKISYTTLMKAFALSGQPNLASKVFDKMLKDRRVKVDQVAWNMLVESYCKLGLTEEAKKVVEKMKEHGFHPNVATYGSLANGIAVARKPGEALLLWKEVKERCKARKKEEESSDETPLAPPIEPDEGLLDTLADICVRAAFFKKALEIGACMEEYGISPNKNKLGRIYVEMHSRMFTSKHASQARQDKRKERKRAAEAFKFWLGLPNNYYSSDWTMFPRDNADESWKK